MNKLRTKINMLKDGFLAGSFNEQFEIALYTTYLLILIISYLIFFISRTVFHLNHLTTFVIEVTIELLLLYFSYRLSYLTLKIILFFFGRYGRVVTKKDWKNMKKYGRKLYKLIWSNKSYGHCYDISRAIAVHLSDVQLMYCAISCKDGSLTCHSVIVKNNSVFDTNLKIHENYDEFIEDRKAIVYKFFSYEEYIKESFFNDIEDDLLKWCINNNVYLDFGNKQFRPTLK